MGSCGRTVFTKRTLLVFSGGHPRGRCCLPLPVAAEDVGSMLLAYVHERPLPYCVDSRGILWAEHTVAEAVVRHGDEDETALYLYSDQEEDHDFEVWLWKLLREVRVAELMPSEKVLLMADFFQGGRAGFWISFFEGEQMASGSATVVPAPHSDLLQGSLEAGPDGEVGAFRMDPAESRLGMRRSFPQAGLCEPAGSLHFRVRFFDALGEDAAADDSALWLGLRTRFGSCAVGIGPVLKDCYSFANGVCPEGQPGREECWQGSTLKRTTGWHSLEVVQQESHMTFSVDGNLVVRSEAEGGNGFAADGYIWLVSMRGAPVCWTALEVIHAPPEELCAVKRCWEVRSEERGRWEFDGSIIWRRELIEEEEEEEEEELAEEMPSSMLSIPCWSLQQADLERIDELMASFLDVLREAGVALPSNVERVGLSEKHQGCIIYTFGTRRLHIATKEGKDGRLLLVVRCGGGFLDFADFARRHGKREHIKWQRKSSGESGDQVVRLVSVRSNKGVRLHEAPGSSSHGASSSSRGGSKSGRRESKSESRTESRRGAATPPPPATCTRSSPPRRDSVRHRPPTVPAAPLPPPGSIKWQG